MQPATLSTHQEKWKLAAALWRNNAEWIYMLAIYKYNPSSKDPREPDDYIAQALLHMQMMCSTEEEEEKDAISLSGGMLDGRAHLYSFTTLEPAPSSSSSPGTAGVDNSMLTQQKRKFFFLLLLLWAEHFFFLSVRMGGCVCADLNAVIDHAALLGVKNSISFLLFSFSLIDMSS